MLTFITFFKGIGIIMNLLSRIGITLLLMICHSLRYDINSLSAQDLPEIKSPQIIGDLRTIKLPATVTSWCVGGNGRYVVMHFDELQKLGILDVNELKIIGYLTVTDTKTKFAAGATKLLTVDNANKTIIRWDLATQTKELSQTIESKTGIGKLFLGSACAGPAYAIPEDTYKEPFKIIDTETLATQEYQYHSKAFTLHLQRTSDFLGAVSSNGKTVSIWHPISQDRYAFQFQADGFRTIEFENSLSWRTGSLGGGIFPNADGQLLYTASYLYRQNGTLIEKRIEPSTRYSTSAILPAVHGPFCLQFSEKSIELKTQGDQRPLAVLDKIASI